MRRATTSRSSQGPRTMSPGTCAYRSSSSIQKAASSRFRPRACGSQMGSTQRRSSSRARSSSGSVCPEETQPTPVTSTWRGSGFPARGSTGFSPSPKVELRRCRPSGTSSWRRRTRRLTSAIRPIASNNPTVASTGGDFSKLTTRTPPDESLLEHSIAESLQAKAPFVVTFSTPKFCSSRTCGPVVDVVEEVASRFEGGDVRFIHVEVYEGNDPAKGYNRWMQEWGLTTEPWTFLVDRDGKIVERYEGVVSVNELEQAVHDKLTVEASDGLGTLDTEPRRRVRYERLHDERRSSRPTGSPSVLPSPVWSSPRWTRTRSSTRKGTFPAR